jgi:DNA-binding HxlR family transcriptional regulator
MITKRSPCPVASTLDIIGDKWTLLVIRDLFAGKSYFKEFAASPEKIATNILSSRLKQLESAGLVLKSKETETTSKTAYKLTKKGQSLYQILDVIAEWGLTNIVGTRKFIDVEKPLK